MEKSNNCFDIKLPLNLKWKLEENVIVAACDMCPTFGYCGDVFYMGSSDFTGLHSDPHLCPQCFRHRASLFFKKFKQLTGCRVTFIETILEQPNNDVKEVIDCIQMVSGYDLPSSTTRSGDYDAGWYMNFLKKLLELSQDEEAQKVLVKAKFLNPQKND
jgi:hypothetical protein